MAPSGCIAGLVDILAEFETQRSAAAQVWATAGSYRRSRSSRSGTTSSPSCSSRRRGTRRARTGRPSGTWSWRDRMTLAVSDRGPADAGGAGSRSRRRWRCRVAAPPRGATWIFRGASVPTPQKSSRRARPAQVRRPPLHGRQVDHGHCGRASARDGAAAAREHDGSRPPRAARRTEPLARRAPRVRRPAWRVTSRRLGGGVAAAASRRHSSWRWRRGGGVALSVGRRRR